MTKLYYQRTGGRHGLVQPQGVELKNQQHMDTAFCVDCLEEAIQRHGAPEIFNTDHERVHQRSLSAGSPGAFRADQHGWPWPPGAGQYLRGAAMAER